MSQIPAMPKVWIAEILTPDDLNAAFQHLLNYANSLFLSKDESGQSVTVAVTFTATQAFAAITATTGTFSGAISGTTISGTTGTFTGAVAGAAGTFSGLLTAQAGLTVSDGNLLLSSGQAAATYFNAGDSGTAKTIDWANGNWQRLRLTGNCTLTFSNPITGAGYRLDLLQDGTGTRTVTWPATVKHDFNATPVLTTTVDRKDSFVFGWNGVAYGTTQILTAVADTT